ncbi:MAG: hypothetical protein RR061_06290 [Muribaculaceae bacterium]
MEFIDCHSMCMWLIMIASISVTALIGALIDRIVINRSRNRR